MTVSAWHNRAVVAAITIGMTMAAGTLPSQATEAGWALLRNGGHTVLIRHAMTIGTIDDSQADPADCTTQNRLSEQGRLQARRMGALLATRSAPVERVASSEYCAAMETARSAFPSSDIESEPAFDSIDGHLSNEDQIVAMKQALGHSPRSGNFIYITHQGNIQALTGQNAREGEAVIVREDGENITVLGRIIFR